MMIGNMGDVASLSDKLALMPDQQLPRLAQQYKGDAITLSLILGEKNRRERVRNAMTSQAGAQPQPKVNDQIVASMQPQQLPENIGIGALPAQNMQNMADGGIVGYADDEAQLAYNNEPVMRMAEGGAARYNGQSASLVGGVDYSYDPWAMPSAERQAALQQKAGTAKFVTSTPDIVRRAQFKQMNNMPLTQEEAGALDASRVGSVFTPGSTSGLRPVADSVDDAKGEAAPKAEAGSGKTDYSVLKTAGAPRAGGAGIGDLAATFNKIYKEAPGEDPASKERKALGEEMVAGAEKRLTSLKEEQAARGDVYKGREERLATREKELEKSKENNTGLSLLEAGLAIMSTPGHWAEAIGKGARVGTARYAEGIDKLRAAQERLGEARDRMEDLKINRDDMNARELRQANNEITQARLDSRKLGIEGIMAAAGVKEKRAATVFDATVRQALTREEIQGRKDVAAMPSGTERIALLLGGGNLEKGMTRMADIQAGKFNPMNAYTEYVSKRKEGDTVLSPAEFVAQIKSVSALMAGAPTPTSEPTGKVRD